MPKLIIDTIPLEVPEGTNVLEAARSIGIVIPHFCWHPALGKAGACRVCAVKMLEGPVKGVQMSCMLPAQDGMVVSTTDGEAVAMRRAVIEWLMINHPHDCPVCDEGGECQLQDFTIAGGHGIRRYDGAKRTHVNQYLGEYIEHEMNRCIQCYRCVRFYQEYAGGTDFGVLGRSGAVYFGRQQDGRLESPFSGNLADICPTGVFTDKTARFRARYWDYDMAPSVCPHCSLGCATVPMARYRELLKVTARRNDAVNGWFICDRGRFTNAAVNAADRPRQALIDGRTATLDVALDAAVERVQEFVKRHGSEALAIVGSPRMAHEGNIMAARLREVLNAGALCYFDAALDAARSMAAAARLTTANAASQEDVRRADMVALVDCALLDEAPMMALAVRQAWRGGAKVYVVGRDGFDATTIGQMFEVIEVASLDDVPFAAAGHPVIVHGSRHAAQEAVLSASTGVAKLAYLFAGSNSFGCACLATKHAAVSCSDAFATGKIKGVISFEADFSAPPGIAVLVAVDWQATALLQQAEIVLPVTSWVEMDGTFVNHAGRAQRFMRVMQPGLPLKGLDPAGHPPRQHRHDAPGGDARPSHDLIAEIITRCGGKNVEMILDEESDSILATEVTEN